MQITHLEVGCHDPPALEPFYVAKLGFPLDGRDFDSFTVRAGWTHLTFRRRVDSQPIHYALNIPQNQMEPAAWWLAARTPLVGDSHGVDRFMHKEWHAESVYFRDPEGNLGELIARQGMRPDAFGAFDVHQVIGVSEVGIATDNAYGLGAELRRRCALKPYKDVNDTFFPVGSPAGMLLLVETGRPWFPDFTSIALPSPIALRFRDEEYKWFTLKFRDEEGVIVKVGDGFDWV